MCDSKIQKELHFHQFCYLKFFEFVKFNFLQKKEVEIDRK